MIPILDSKRQYQKIGNEVEKAVCEVLRSGSYILGPNVKALESELASYIFGPNGPEAVGGDHGVTFLPHSGKCHPRCVAPGVGSSFEIHPVEADRAPAVGALDPVHLGPVAG